MRIEVAFARAEVQWVIPLELPEGATVQQAIDASRISVRVPELDLAGAAVGIFGRVVERDQRLEPGDRVEIYRPLPTEPKQMRRRRVAAQRRR